MPIIDRLTSVGGLPDATGHAHAVVTSGRLAFVAGQVAMDSDGGLVGAGDIRAQTEQAMRNLGAVLTRDEFLRPALGDRINPRAR